MLKLDVRRDSSNRVAHGDSDLDALDFEWHSIAKHLPGGGSKSADEFDQYGQLIYGAAVDGEGVGRKPHLNHESSPKSRHWLRFVVQALSER